MVLLSLIIWLAVILLDAVFDYIEIKKALGVNHTIETIIRAGLAILIGAFGLNVQPHQFAEWFFAFAGSFWWLFDLSENILNGWKPFNLGTTAAIDIFGHEHPIDYWSFKVLMLIGCILGWYQLFIHPNPVAQLFF